MVAFVKYLLDMFFPRRCAACRAGLGRRRRGDDSGLCQMCHDTLVSALDAYCPSCGAVWLDAPPGGGQHMCGACLTDPPPWVEARAAYAYGGALQDAIARWKNPPIGAATDALSPTLTRLMADSAERACWTAVPEDAIVVPMPSAKGALRRRGFNPAGVLARALSRKVRRRFEPTALALRRAPDHSAGLSRKERRRRVRGVFRAREKVVAGRSILLVDDVMTTGATAREATRALLRAGARGVRVACLARVPGNR